MGLDIYCHRIKKSVADKYNLSMESDYSDLSDALDKEAKMAFERTTNRMLPYLRKVYKGNNDLEYQNEYAKFIKRLKKNIPLYKEYDYKLQTYGFNIFTNELEIKNPDEVQKIFKQELKTCFAPNDVYFRKFNFVYSFFSNDIVEKTQTCVVDKHRIGQLIDTCKDVLKYKGDEDYARENLPTQGGFFFGSIEYDDYYWKCVKYCLKCIKKLYKAMDDEDFVLWYFSW
jgi:hypothetical protein